MLYSSLRGLQAAVLKQQQQVSESQFQVKVVGKTPSEETASGASASTCKDDNESAASTSTFMSCDCDQIDINNEGILPSQKLIDVGDVDMFNPEKEPCIVSDIIALSVPIQLDC